MEYYKGKGVPENRLFLVPSTVDPNRFANVSKETAPLPYIGYFGSLTFKRDNVDGLIKAFSSICQKYPDLQLILGGFCSDDEKNDILKLIQNLEIQNKVQMLGYLKREEIINYVYHAHVLVMVRGNNLESKASYPSKLSEFLASAKPVISVNVGEIPLYLTDEKNIFLVEPENVDALASKLDYVLSNYDHALEVGKQGKALTDTIFNYNFQAKRMLDFIYSLK
jgi:glycosyltransferase involved in cell wall biosynthesis